MHDISRDRLSIIRVAQIRYLFRHRYGLSKIKVGLAGGSYWMSIPCIINGIDRSTGTEKRFMGKIINDRSALKHKYMTRLRNLGAFVAGTNFVFDRHAGAQDMIEFERDSLVKLKTQNVNVPEVYGLHKLNFEDYILVMELLDGEPLSGVEIDGEIADLVFLTLKIMHDNGVFHGDVKLDNFL
jgi:RIO-like serine/threonine protein kinase